MTTEYTQLIKNTDRFYERYVYNQPTNFMLHGWTVHIEKGKSGDTIYKVVFTMEGFQPLVVPVSISLLKEARTDEFMAAMSEKVLNHHADQRIMRGAPSMTQKKVTATAEEIGIKSTITEALEGDHFIRLAPPEKEVLGRRSMMEKMPGLSPIGPMALAEEQALSMETFQKSVEAMKLGSHETTLYTAIMHSYMKEALMAETVFPKMLMTEGTLPEPKGPDAKDTGDWEL